MISSKIIRLMPVKVLLSQIYFFNAFVSEYERKNNVADKPKNDQNVQGKIYV